VVLAVGALPAAPLAKLPADPRVITDPWAPGALDADAATTLVVGTGLTAVDVALSTAARGGRVIAVSRRGRLPFAHLPGPRSPAPPPQLPDREMPLPKLEFRLVAHGLRMQEQGYDWRDAMDGLRPITSELWRRLDEHDRRRFLQDRCRAWEVRRHRMAPEVAERVRRLRAEGGLTILAGQIAVAVLRPEGIDVVIRGRGERRFVVDRVVACTGAGSDVREADDPLLRSLMATGTAVADPLGLGLRTARGGALLDGEGRPSARLFALGALRRGDLWETTAVPEIRLQAEQLAERLTVQPHIAAAEGQASMAANL
jgi:uncharacterized NAD(P)/FAD-binding protein YdhS